MQDHRRLQVYQAARELALEVYAVAKTLPAEERFDLTRQIKRAAVSVGSNIAEGCGRATSRDLCSFLDVALGSARELEFQLDLLGHAGLASPTLIGPTLERTRRVQQMLTRLIVQIRIRSRKPHDD